MRVQTKAPVRQLGEAAQHPVGLVAVGVADPDQSVLDAVLRARSIGGVAVAGAHRGAVDRRHAGTVRGLGRARTSRCADRRRRPVRHRRRLPAGDQVPRQDLRGPRGARGQRRHLGPVPLSRAFARTRTCSRWAIPSGPGRRPSRSPTARRSSSTCARRPAAYGVEDKIRYRHSVVRAEWSSADARWTVEVERGDGRARDADLRLPLHVQRLLPLRRRLHAGVRGHRAVRRPDRASAALARGPGLRRQARGGDRQRRHGGHARARDGRERGARDDAPALAELRGRAAGRGPDREGRAAPAADQGAPTPWCAGRTS